MESTTNPVSVNVVLDIATLCLLDVLVSAHELGDISEAIIFAAHYTFTDTIEQDSAE